MQAMWETEPQSHRLAGQISLANNSGAINHSHEMFLLYEDENGNAVI